MTPLTKKQNFQLWFATIALTMIASLGSANADVCTAALEMHQKIVSAHFVEYNKEAEEKNKLQMVERAKADCEMVKREVERREVRLTLIKEDERVCSRERLKKALRCDSACEKASLDNAKTAAKTACDQYEKEKGEAEARAAKK